MVGYEVAAACYFWLFKTIKLCVIKWERSSSIISTVLSLVLKKSISIAVMLITGLPHWSLIWYQYQWGN